MKIISYSLFGDTDSFEFPFYLRGFYFNLRMNQLIYPSWQTSLHVSTEVYDRYQNLLHELWIAMPFFTHIMPPAPKCEAMLWRLLPMYREDVTHVICRDADAITTYREAQAVQEWEDSGLGAHGITDDPAHTIPIMGGMCGFKADKFRKLFPDFRSLIGKANLKDHGSDQNLLMQRVYPLVKNDMMGHFFKGCKERVKDNRESVYKEVPGVSPKLWESNLTCRMIGSPGVVDMELLRFFTRFDNRLKYNLFEEKYPKIFYWI